MESSTAPVVGDGQLGGINPSEDVDDELAKLSGQAEEDTGGEAAKPEPVSEESPGVREPEPEPEPAKKGSSASRPYVVLKVDTFDDGEEYTTKVHEVVSRNATNALRKAARELHGRLDSDTAVLLVIPKSMWRPTPVSLTVSERVSVSIG